MHFSSIRQFNSGHSLHDALWTANRLSRVRKIDWNIDFSRYPKEVTLKDPTKAHIMDYEKFFNLFDGTEAGKTIEKAVSEAMQSTIQYFRDHSDRKIGNENEAEKTFDHAEHEA